MKKNIKEKMKENIKENIVNIALYGVAGLAIAANAVIWKKLSDIEKGNI